MNIKHIIVAIKKISFLHFININFAVFIVLLILPLKKYKTLLYYCTKLLLKNEIQRKFI